MTLPGFFRLLFFPALAFLAVAHPTVAAQTGLADSILNGAATPIVIKISDPPSASILDTFRNMAQTHIREHLPKYRQGVPSDGIEIFSRSLDSVSLALFRERLIRLYDAYSRSKELHGISLTREAFVEGVLRDRKVEISQRIETFRANGGWETILSRARGELVAEQRRQVLHTAFPPNDEAVAISFSGYAWRDALLKQVGHRIQKHCKEPLFRENEMLSTEVVAEIDSQYAKQQKAAEDSLTVVVKDGTLCTPGQLETAVLSRVAPLFAQAKMQTGSIPRYTLFNDIAASIKDRAEKASREKVRRTIPGFDAQKVAPPPDSEIYNRIIKKTSDYTQYSAGLRLSLNHALPAYVSAFASYYAENAKPEFRTRAREYAAVQCTTDVDLRGLLEKKVQPVVEPVFRSARARAVNEQMETYFWSLQHDSYEPDTTLIYSCHYNPSGFYSIDTISLLTGGQRDTAHKINAPAKPSDAALFDSTVDRARGRFMRAIKEGARAFAGQISIVNMVLDEKEQGQIKTLSRGKIRKALYDTYRHNVETVWIEERVKRIWLDERLPVPAFRKNRYADLFDRTILEIERIIDHCLQSAQQTAMDELRDCIDAEFARLKEESFADTSRDAGKRLEMEIVNRCLKSSTKELLRADSLPNPIDSLFWILWIKAIGKGKSKGTIDQASAASGSQGDGDSETSPAQGLSKGKIIVGHIRDFIHAVGGLLVDAVRGLWALFWPYGLLLAGLLILGLLLFYIVKLFRKKPVLPPPEPLSSSPKHNPGVPVPDQPQGHTGSGAPILPTTGNKMQTGTGKKGGWWKGFAQGVLWFIGLFGGLWGLWAAGFGLLALILSPLALILAVTKVALFLPFKNKPTGFLVRISSKTIRRMARLTILLILLVALYHAYLFIKFLVLAYINHWTVFQAIEWLQTQVPYSWWPDRLHIMVALHGLFFALSTILLSVLVLKCEVQFSIGNAVARLLMDMGCDTAWSVGVGQGVNRITNYILDIFCKILGIKLGFSITFKDVFIPPRK